MDIKKRRRQVAWICFAPHLAEEKLIASIKILEHGFQLDGGVNLIAYIAKVCMELGIDLQHHNKLCSQFNTLLAESTELAVQDPLLWMQQESSGVKSGSSFPDISKQVEKPAYALVFIAFMRYIIEYTPNRIQLFAMLIELAMDKKQASQELTGYIMQWTEKPNNFAWVENLNQQVLTLLVHLVYMALCELLGPVAADDSFHRALTTCEKIPEARIFPPAQFL